MTFFARMLGAMTTRNCELVIWVLGFLGAVAAFLLAHTFVVTAATYAYGAVLLGITLGLFWFRFRPQQTQPARWLKVTGNAILVVLSGIVLLYALGVATWYE